MQTQKKSISNSVRTLCILLFLFLLLLGSALVYRGLSFAQNIAIPHAQYGLLGKLFFPTKVVFTGDIMLGRDVERTIDAHDIYYPFIHLAPIFQNHDFVVGNFEASVPALHVSTPLNEMRFSVREEFLTSLHTIGFDLLSLANNHSLDSGETGYLNTRKVCTDAHLECIGHAFKVSTSSLYTANIGNVRVGMLFLHASSNLYTVEDLMPLVQTLNSTSETQIAYIHWGDEYEPMHSTSQSELAHILIDNGIDAVIGHHPHVIQDIERYKNKPIFYSLGNLIFDQYFNNEVQQGYLLSLEFKKRELIYTLLPYETLTVRSQPAFVSEEMRKQIFERILPYTMFTEEEVQLGSFVVPRD